MRITKVADGFKGIDRIETTDELLGGDEFLAVLLGASVNDVLQTAEKIRRQIDEKLITYGDQNIHITISIGGVSFPERDVKNVQDLIDSADRSQYSAKKIQAGTGQLSEAEDPGNPLRPCPPDKRYRFSSLNRVHTAFPSTGYGFRPLTVTTSTRSTGISFVAVSRRGSAGAGIIAIPGFLSSSIPDGKSRIRVCLICFPCPASLDSRTRFSRFMRKYVGNAGEKRAGGYRASGSVK